MVQRIFDSIMEWALVVLVGGVLYTVYSMPSQGELQGLIHKAIQQGPVKAAPLTIARK